MPRCARVDVGGEVYHVLNRANGRMTIFENDSDYRLFETLLYDTQELTGMRLLAYVIMPNHFHLALYPQHDGDLGEFMQRLTNSHTRKVHALTETNGSGHLYQGRYKSFLVDSDTYLLTLLKYIERNPARARLADDPASWRWSSAWCREKGNSKQQAILAEPPTPLPSDYRTWLRTVDKQEDLANIRNAANRGTPYGRESWVEHMVTKHRLESTVRLPGRPRRY